ncbi:hypothetical protein JCM3770_001807, partial [Rhodotorula araucariae]
MTARGLWHLLRTAAVRQQQRSGHNDILASFDSVRLALREIARGRTDPNLPFIILRDTSTTYYLANEAMVSKHASTSNWHERVKTEQQNLLLRHSAMIAQT